MENSKEKTKGQLLQEQLTWEFPSIAQAAPERVEAAHAFVSHTWLSYPKPRQSVNV